MNGIATLIWIISIIPIAAYRHQGDEGLDAVQGECMRATVLIHVNYRVSELSGYGDVLGTDPAVSHQPQTSPLTSQQNFNPLQNSDESFALEISKNCADKVGSVPHPSTLWSFKVQRYFGCMNDNPKWDWKRYKIFMHSLITHANWERFALH